MPPITVISTLKMRTARISYSASMVRTAEIGRLPSSWRTISRMGPASVDGSPVDCASIMIRCGFCCLYGRYTNSVGGSAMKRYLVVFASPTIWTHELSSPARRKRLPIGS